MKKQQHDLPKSHDAERFSAAGRGLRDLIGKASPAVKREIVQVFVEELVEPSDPNGTAGTYRLTFFPEIFGNPDPVRPETPNGDGQDQGTRRKARAEPESRTGVKPGA